MAESVNGGSNTPAQPPKEMSMEVRLLIAFLLMGVVMFVTPYFFKSQTPPPLKKDAAGQTASQSTPGAPPASGVQPTPEAPPPAPPADAQYLRRLPPGDLLRHRLQHHILYFHRPLHRGPRISLHAPHGLLSSPPAKRTYHVLSQPDISCATDNE